MVPGTADPGRDPPLEVLEALRAAAARGVLDWLAEHAAEPLTLADIAARAAMSTRSLSRHFRDQTGTTPLRWVIRQRLRNAKRLLESSDQPVERIGADVGFSSPTAFRERFRDLVGVSPRAYRRAFRSRAG